MSAGVVIIGAGHAGGSAAAFLRQYGYEGPITLIAAEPYLPYQRPPLSKAWLKGEAALDDLYLRSDSFYADHGIDVKLDTFCAAIGADRKMAVLTTGFEIAYDHLIIATGSKSRPLTPTLPDAGPWLGRPEGADDTDPLYFSLRTLDDAEKLKSALRPAHRIGLIGAGYIGLEVAASARYLGCEATIFEREPRILGRVASQALSDFFTEAHIRNGVKFVTSCTVADLRHGEGESKFVTLGDGSTHEFDVIVVGIGALPADDLAQMAGLACKNGIIVDDEARTSVPGIFAIGDVTSRTLPFYPGRYRLESVPNALEQAKQAAAAITGHKPPTVETPWFWSDQYEYKLQIAGLMQPGTNPILRGDPTTGGFSVYHLDGSHRLQAAECVNRPADFMAAKQLIAKGPMLDIEVVKDPAVSLKPFLAI